MARLQWLEANNMKQNARMFFAELYDRWHSAAMRENTSVEKATKRVEAALRIYQRAGGEKFAAELRTAEMRLEVARANAERIHAIYMQAHGLYYRINDPGWGNEPITFTESWAKVDRDLRAAIVAGPADPYQGQNRRFRLRAERCERWNEAKWAQRDADSAAGLDTSWTDDVPSLSPKTTRELKQLGQL